MTGHERRLTALEVQAGMNGPVHERVFSLKGETQADFDRQIAELIASGQAVENDLFICRWILCPPPRDDDAAARTATARVGLRGDSTAERQPRPPARDPRWTDTAPLIVSNLPATP